MSDFTVSVLILHLMGAFVFSLEDTFCHERKELSQ